MESFFLKLAGPLKSFGKWLLAFMVDQTKIVIIGSSSPTQSPNSLLINTDQYGKGELIFGITTKSVQPVELVKLTIDYSAPLQLFDPINMGFFSMSSTGDETLPFRIYWEGSIELQQMIIHAFALTTQFPIGSSQLPIRISAHARVQKLSIGGFTEHGRTQLTSSIHRIVRTPEPVGLAVPPKHSFTSSQPFILQSALYVSSGAKDIAPLLVHEQLTDGTVSSELVDISNSRQLQ